MTQAGRWVDGKHHGWSTVHSDDVLRSLRRDIFPAIGEMPIVSIKAPLMLDVLKQVEKRGAVETTHRLRQRLSAIFTFGSAA